MLGVTSLIDPTIIVILSYNYYVDPTIIIITIEKNSCLPIRAFIISLF